MMAAQNPLLRLPAVGDNAAMQTEPPKAEPPKRKRRWFQFSLRALMMFTVVCAIGSAWVARKMERKRKEREAVEAIGRLGGRTWYEYQSVKGAKPPGPDWLRELLGENSFSEVSVVNLDAEPFLNPKSSGEAQERFDLITRSLTVHPNGSKVTDEDLIHLEALVHIKTLNLGRTKISDAGLTHLAGLSQLQTLYLYGTCVGDSGLVQIKELPQLQMLNLRETVVTDAGLADLEALGQLRAIDLRETTVSDAGLAHLNSMVQLRELNLWGTKVTDAGLVDIEGLSQLEWLDLGSTRISDAGLKHLKGLRHLQKVDLWLTNVSDAGVNDLQEALPKCEIWTIEHFGEPGRTWYKRKLSMSDGQE
jgi:Leucine Rich repeat